MGDSYTEKAKVSNDIIRSVFAFLDRPAYWLLGIVYQLFFNVASADLFSNDTIMKFYGRVQVILGVFMMFQLAMTILRGIVEPDNFTKDDFLSVLPSPKHERYKEIMMRLHAESLKEKNGIVDILPLADSKEELEELKSALIKEDNKIKLIREELKSKESGEPQREIKNTIIVYPHIIDEMRDDINSEEYLHFKKLIDSIIDGTFKNVKTFNNGINKFGGISQVKLKHLQPRVAFKKLDNHTYALVTCFIKQVTRDNAYIKTYRNSITYFKTVLLDETKKSLNDPEFMLENEKRIKTLYEIMTSKQKPEGKEK